MTDKIDIPSFQIAASKMHANGNAYFKLFEKHVPRNLDQDSVVLLYKLDNLSCIYKIVNMNSKAHYVVVSNDAVNAALQVVLDKAIDVKYIKEFDLEKTNMKFDCIVMNPPYQRNLHLKILAEAIKHLKDEKSVCVNLAPIDKFQKAVKTEKDLPVAVDSIEVVEHEDMCSLFGIGLWVDGGVMVATSARTKDSSKFAHIVKHLKLFKKIANKVVPLSSKFEDEPGKLPLRFFVGCNCDNSHGYTMSPKTYEDATSVSVNGHIRFINMLSEVERMNLYKTCSLVFMKFCCMLDLGIRPWLGDAVNPRTGKKGYQSEWTNDDLYRFFNITLEEQKVIEETMKKYDSK